MYQEQHHHHPYLLNNNKYNHHQKQEQQRLFYIENACKRAEVSKIVNGMRKRLEYAIYKVIQEQKRQKQIHYHPYYYHHHYYSNYDHRQQQIEQKQPPIIAPSSSAPSSLTSSSLSSSPSKCLPSGGSKYLTVPNKNITTGSTVSTNTACSTSNVNHHVNGCQVRPRAISGGPHYYLTPKASPMLYQQSTLPEKSVYMECSFMKPTTHHQTNYHQYHINNHNNNNYHYSYLPQPSTYWNRKHQILPSFNGQIMTPMGSPISRPSARSCPRTSKADIEGANILMMMQYKI